MNRVYIDFDPRYDHIFGGHRVNPAPDYRKMARTIVEKFKDNLILAIDQGQTPDLYWKLETALMEAFKFVDKRTETRVKAELYKMIEEFDENNGTSTS